MCMLVAAVKAVLLLWLPRLVVQAKESLKSIRSRALRLLEKMRTSPPVSPAVSDTVPLHVDLLRESHWTNRVLYELFAGFLAESYVQEAGPNQGAKLNPKTALNYLGALVQAARGLCKGQSAETQLFFACADPGSVTEDAAWYRGVRRNLEDAMFRKAVHHQSVTSGAPHWLPSDATS